MLITSFPVTALRLITFRREPVTSLQVCTTMLGVIVDWPSSNRQRCFEFILGVEGEYRDRGGEDQENNGVLVEV